MNCIYVAGSFIYFTIKKIKKHLKNPEIGDFPGGSVAENLPCNAGDANLIPVGETKIPLDWEKLSFRTTTRESVRHQQIPSATTKTRHNQVKNKITYFFLKKGNTF